VRAVSIEKQTYSLQNSPWENDKPL